MDHGYEPSDSQLEEAFARAVGVLMRNAHVIDGVVTALDWPEAFTCTVTVGDDETAADFGGVLLRVVSAGQASIVEVPKIGTACTILFRDGNQGRPQLFQCQEASNLLLTSDQITANDGGNGGMINIEQAINEWQSIKDDVNLIKSIFLGWVPVPGDGGGALKTATAAWAAQQLPPVNRQDLEDTKFTH